MRRISVLGAGAFGTALASVFARGGLSVTLWGRDGDALAAMAATGVNEKYLPGCPLPADLRFEADLAVACGTADLLLLAVPAQQTGRFCAGLPGDVPRIVVAKGIDAQTRKLPHETAAAVAVLSGPGFAAELAGGKPTALSLACADPALGAQLMECLSSDTLRLYLSGDMTGVALGGALKNVYAIACGLVVGADLGESARAALMTRGFAEMSRLGQAMGARRETLVGLSGLGDLALTCTSVQSRNFAYGHDLGARGNRAAGKMVSGKTVEGVASARAVLELGRDHGVDLPIARAVADVLEARLDVAAAVSALMSRPLRRET